MRKAFLGTIQKSQNCQEKKINKFYYIKNKWPKKAKNNKKPTNGPDGWGE